MLYSGAESSPTLIPGVYNLTNGTGSGSNFGSVWDRTGTLTISTTAAPEIDGATLPLGVFMFGMGMLMLHIRRRQSGVGRAAARA